MNELINSTALVLEMSYTSKWVCYAWSASKAFLVCLSSLSSNRECNEYCFPYKSTLPEPEL